MSGITQDQGVWLGYKDAGDLRELSGGNKSHTSWELENCTLPFFLGSHVFSLLLLPVYLCSSFCMHFLQRLIILLPRDSGLHLTLGGCGIDSGPNSL